MASGQDRYRLLIEGTLKTDKIEADIKAISEKSMVKLRVSLDEKSKADLWKTVSALQEAGNKVTKIRLTEGKVRPLQFDDAARIAILKWLEIRGDDDCPYVFVAKHENKYKQISKNTFNSWTEGYFEPIVGRRVHPHLFRESRATSMVVEQGKDIKAAQKLLGHKSSTTTEIYVIRKDDEDSDDAFI